MKRFLSIFLAFLLILSSFSVSAFAVKQEEKNMYTFDYAGNSFSYYKDEQGNPYIIENGIKYYVAIPDSIQRVTDESKLERLRGGLDDCNSQNNTRASLVLFSQTVYFSPLAYTGELNVTDNYLYLKCTDLNPSNAERGFSYWIYYCIEEEWFEAFYVNKSLSSYTRHPMSTLGSARHIKINIFSYYGTVSSCTLSVKQGGIFG